MLKEDIAAPHDCHHHSTHKNHDVRNPSPNSRCRPSELDPLLAAALPPTPNVKVRSIGGVYQRVVLAKFASPSPVRLKRNIFTSSGSPNKYNQLLTPLKHLTARECNRDVLALWFGGMVCRNGSISCFSCLKKKEKSSRTFRQCPHHPSVFS